MRGEIVPDERIVFAATVHGDLKILTTVTFAETDGNTTLTGIRSTRTSPTPPAARTRAGP